jgi:hypothetical protein
MSEITISKRNIALIIGCFLIYFNLSDAFRSTGFRENIKIMVQNTTKYNHTILDNLDTAANTVAGITSITSVAIINKLPVRNILRFSILKFLLFGKVFHFYF